MKTALILFSCMMVLAFSCGRKATKKEPPTPEPPASEAVAEPDSRPDPHNVRRDVQTELQRRDEQLQKRMDEIDPR